MFPQRRQNHLANSWSVDYIVPKNSLTQLQAPGVSLVNLSAMNFRAPRGFSPGTCHPAYSFSSAILSGQASWVPDIPRTKSVRDSMFSQESIAREKANRRGVREQQTLHYTYQGCHQNHSGIPRCPVHRTGCIRSVHSWCVFIVRVHADVFPERSNTQHLRMSGKMP